MRLGDAGDASDEDGLPVRSVEMAADRDALSDAALPFTVVVPSWRRPDWLTRCLDALIKLDPRPQRILVVGRADDEPTQNVVSSYSAVEWLTVSTAGYVAPIRTALAAVTTPFVAVIDDDAEPAQSDWLLKLAHCVTEEGVAVAGSRVVNDNAGASRVSDASGRVSWYGRVGGNVGSRTDPLPVEVDALPEGNWSWRTSVLKTIAIDPIFDSGDATMYGLDLCLQAKRRGWRVVFTREAPILHHFAPRGSEQAIARHDRAAAVYSYTRNVTYLALKHFRWRLPAFIVWSTLIGDSAYLGLLSVAREAFKGRLRAEIAKACVAGRFAGVRAWRETRSANRSGAHT